MPESATPVLSAGWSGNATLYRNGKQRSLTANLLRETSGATVASICTVPAGDRPVGTFFAGTYYGGSLSGAHGSIAVIGSGLVYSPSGYQVGSLAVGQYIGIEASWYTA